MKKFPVLVFTLALIFSTSCGQEREKSQSTTIRITQAAVAEGVPNQNGGIIVYLREHNLQEFFSFKVDSDTESVQKTINNGTWDFAALSWVGSNNMEGDVRCSDQTFVANGTNRTIDIKLKKDQCNEGIFGSEDYYELVDNKPQFYPLKVVTCQRGASLTNSSQNCNTEKGEADSFKVILPTYKTTGYNTFKNHFQSDTSIENFINYDGALTSECYTIPDSSSYKTTEMHIPIGESYTGTEEPRPFPIVVKAYDDDSCGTLLKTYNFPFGLQEDDGSFNNTESAVSTTSSGTDTYTTLFLKDAVDDIEHIFDEVGSSELALFANTIGTASFQPSITPVSSSAIYIARVEDNSTPVYSIAKIKVDDLGSTNVTFDYVSYEFSDSTYTNVINTYTCTNLTLTSLLETKLNHATCGNSFQSPSTLQFSGGNTIQAYNSSYLSLYTLFSGQ